MNKKVFDIRLRSLAHYDNEEKQLLEALRITKATKEELVTSLVEHCPFESGQLIAKGDRMMKCTAVLNAGRSDTKDIYYRLEVKYPSMHGGWGDKKIEIAYLKDIEQYKILHTVE